MTGLLTPLQAQPIAAVDRHISGTAVPDCTAQRHNLRFDRRDQPPPMSYGQIPQENDMSIETLTREVAELRRRMDAAEVRLSEVAGQFEFISGQLREVQRFNLARFDTIDDRLNKLDAKVDTLDAKVDALDAKVDALPRVIAEMIQKR